MKMPPTRAPALVSRGHQEAGGFPPGTALWEAGVAQSVVARALHTFQEAYGDLERGEKRVKHRAGSVKRTVGHECISSSCTQPSTGTLKPN